MACMPCKCRISCFSLSLPSLPLGRWEQAIREVFASLSHVAAWQNYTSCSHLCICESYGITFTYHKGSYSDLVNLSTSRDRPECRDTWDMSVLEYGSSLRLLCPEAVGPVRHPNVYLDIPSSHKLKPQQKNSPAHRFLKLSKQDDLPLGTNMWYPRQPFALTIDALRAPPSPYNFLSIFVTLCAC